MDKLSEADLTAAVAGLKQLRAAEANKKEVAKSAVGLLCEVMKHHREFTGGTSRAALVRTWLKSCFTLGQSLHKWRSVATEAVGRMVAAECWDWEGEDMVTQAGLCNWSPAYLSGLLEGRLFERLLMRSLDSLMQFLKVVANRDAAVRVAERLSKFAAQDAKHVCEKLAENLVGPQGGASVLIMLQMLVGGVKEADAL